MTQVLNIGQAVNEEEAIAEMRAKLEAQYDYEADMENHAILRMNRQRARRNWSQGRGM